MKEYPPSVVEAARKIRLLAFDVDGVLTDGGITYTSSGEEFKTFHVRDGHALKLAARAGLDAALITGRRSSMVQRRGEELGIAHIFQGAKEKLSSLREILERTGLEAAQIAYMGDDVVDLPVMLAVGLSCCPSDAAQEVRLRADLVTEAAGGRGAARELIFFVLRTQGLLDPLMERYLGS